jgi:hypothetical protein
VCVCARARACGWKGRCECMSLGECLRACRLTYPVCHAQASYCLSPLTRPYFSTLSYRRHDFRGEEGHSTRNACFDFLYKLYLKLFFLMCVAPCIFVYDYNYVHVDNYNHLFETFLTLRRNQRVIVINLKTSVFKIPVIRV